MFPQTREQRCSLHKIANVLAALPTSAHPVAKRALAEISNAEDLGHARRAVATFKLGYGAKFGKAVAMAAPQLVAIVRAGARFHDGTLVERAPADAATKATAA